MSLSLRSAWSTLGSVALVLGVGCVGDSPNQVTPDGGGDKDAGVDGATNDGATEAEAGPPNSFNDPTITANWESVPLSVAAGFSGGGALGKYVYFAPNGSKVYRFDTTKDFTQIGSFDSVDLATLSTNTAIPLGFHGAVPDANGRIWFISVGGPSVKCVYAAYIDGKPFDQAAGWNLQGFANDSRMYGYFGGALDGTSMLWFPNVKNDAGTGTQALFLLKHDLGSLGTSANRNLVEISAGFTGFLGGVVSGGSVYPAANAGRAISHPTADLNGTWDSFDLGTLTPPLTASTGVIDDGKYLYYPGTGASGPVVARFDKSGNFTQKTAWSSVKTPNLLGGGRFDGQRVVFAPDGAGAAQIYDTKKPFDVAGSWQSHPLTGKIAGTAFDGQWVYFVPADSSPAQRFHARTVATTPATSGSNF